ncbi:Homocysteine S-methyltransferase [Mycena rebaudengoi]|nr:Homocysteine S-methyltransferase [Mycena rebaudengoi]
MILDGGLGTTLEQTFGLNISHTPLWSAKAAIEHPQVIIDAHLAFLRAGARIILTSTYQCSLSTLEQAGYSVDAAHEIMAKCVQLAAEARARFDAERTGQGLGAAGARIALSLGPFGAGLTPAQEFDGFYPPPFGPRAYTPGGGNRNAFVAREDEGTATAALARYHLERLDAFADDATAWATLDCIAFETVPLLREVRAIRTAMAALETRLGRARAKPWWISFVFPSGQYPETDGPGEGAARVPVRAVVAAALDDSAALPWPSALGINCSETEHLPRILAEMENAVEEFWTDAQSKPWLVIYPNGGDVYDPVSQSWVVKDKGGGVWAEELQGIIMGARRSVWAGVVAGGCCRTGPEDIKLLSSLLATSAGM